MTYAALWRNDGVPLNGSLREIEVRMAPRQSTEDLKCNFEVGPASDSQSASILDIRIERLSVLACHMR